jgi:transposase-like protein
MDLPNDYGLSDILRNEVDISASLQRYDGVRGGVITAGSTPPNPSELLGSMKMDGVLGRLKEISDVVIIDGSPLFVSDALVLSAKVDGVLLVVRLGRTRKKLVKTTLGQLNRSGVRVIGVVLNGVADRGAENYGAYLYSGGEGGKAGDRMPYLSRVLRKFGLAAPEASNGRSSSSGAGKLHRARGSGPNGKKPVKIARSGELCPNEDCPDYGKLQSETQKNIKKSGKSKKGVQRYQCKTCDRTYLGTAGTIFHRKRTSEHEILETLALIAGGNPLSDLSRKKGFGKDTIVQWLQEAARHPEQVNEALVNDFKVGPDQLDTLWISVRKWGGNGSPL